MAGLSPRERELLTRMLISHAYREKLAVQRFTEALKLLPPYEPEKYWLGVIEEEQEHYDGCLDVAEELSIHLSPLIDARMTKEPAGIPQFHSWLDVLLAHAFNDKAGYFVLLGLTQSKVQGYARLARDIIAEEEAHGMAGTKALVSFYLSLP